MCPPNIININKRFILTLYPLFRGDAANAIIAHTIIMFSLHALVCSDTATPELMIQ